MRFTVHFVDRHRRIPELTACRGQFGHRWRFVLTTVMCHHRYECALCGQIHQVRASRGGRRFPPSHFVVAERLR